MTTSESLVLYVFFSFSMMNRVEFNWGHLNNEVNAGGVRVKCVLLNPTPADLSSGIIQRPTPNTRHWSP